MQKNNIFVIDSSILLHDPAVVEAYPGASVIIPIEVIERIERFKKDLAELGRNARQVARILDKFRQLGNVTHGVRLDHGGTVQILMGRPNLNEGDLRPPVDLARAENSLVAHGLALKLKYPESRVSIVSKDINLRIKADAAGLSSETFDKDRFEEALTYNGYHDINFSEEELSEFESHGTLPAEHLTLLPNEYVLMRNQSSGKIVQLAKVAQHKSTVLVPLEFINEELVGLKALNREQHFAVEALLDERIKLVTLFGQAGTGKTLLAVAAGLRQVLRDFIYQKVLVARPVIPMGRDIGFLPGDIDEKMRPWMQPIFDALELIRTTDKRSRRPLLPANILEMEELQVEPLTYIRGRSIPNQFLIIDEAQNLTPLEAKTIITRVGKNTKIILTGDPQQIDNPYMDEFSNGLSYIVGRFRGSDLAAHIHLQKGARSDLAEQAVNLL